MLRDLHMFTKKRIKKKPLYLIKRSSTNYTNGIEFSKVNLHEIYQILTAKINDIKLLRIRSKVCLILDCWLVEKTSKILIG